MAELREVGQPIADQTPVLSIDHLIATVSERQAPCIIFSG
jgi:hypothetical protein